ncbi:MAG: hypothetical protein WC862_02370 [Patescibacteria group bacterium]
MENNNVSTGEILEAINDFSTNVDKRFTKIESDIMVMKSDITTIKSTMVTKDYLDEKLGDLRGDLTVLMRKEDTKVAMLVKILRTRNVITEEDKQQIFAMEPFPQMSV